MLRTKTLAAIGLIAICGAVALTGVAGARTAAKTTVTISYNGDGFEGKVKSPKAKCVKNRTVRVYRQHGSAQSPSTDKRLYTDTSDNQGRWDTGTSGQISGKFYARTGATGGCKRGSSKTIHT